MISQSVETVVQKPKMFLDIPTAATMAGFSLRHFRRIIEEDSIPIVQIGRKFFILVAISALGSPAGNLDGIKHPLTITYAKFNLPETDRQNCR